MKRYILIILYPILFWPVLLSGSSNELKPANIKSARSAAEAVLDLIFLGAKIVGAIAIILGLIELLVEADRGGQQGKKVSGSMKLLGGVLLMLATNVIMWMVGNPNVK